MSDNSNEKVFKATSKILDDRTEITWNWPTIRSFVVERRKIDGGDGSWEEIGRIPADRRSFSMGNSSENSKFEYRVMANTDNEIVFASQVTGIPSLDVKSEASTSKELQVKSKKVPELVPPIAPTPPGPPQGPVNIEWISPRSFKVSWNPPSNDGGSPITSYIIEKENPNKIGKTWSQVNEVPSHKTTASWTLKKCVEKQRFAITAVNACGRSAPLMITNKRPLPTPVVEIDSSNQNYIELKWTFPDLPESKNAEVEYCNIRRRIVGSGDEKMAKIRTKITGDSYRDFDVVRGQKYQYEVVAIAWPGVNSRTVTKHITFQPASTQVKKARKKLREQLEMVQKEASIEEDSMQSIDQMDEPGPSGFKQEVREQQETAPVKRKVGDSKVTPNMKRIKREIESD